MIKYLILRRVLLRQSHRVSGKTRHFRDDKLIGMPAELQIVAFPGEVGFYLLYLDTYGNELTDTYHETIQDAMAQAEWEFEVKANEWEVLHGMPTEQD